MKILGAVLESTSASRPYAESAPIRVCELELAEPGPSEILIRVEYAGLCHSDLSVVDGTRPRPTPMLLGHEAAGIVEIVGECVTHLEIGDRVVTTFLPRCGECSACQTNGKLPCLPGSASNADGSLLAGGRKLSRAHAPVHHHLGVSGFATHAVVDRRSVVRVDADVPAEVAALLGCAVLTGGGAVLNEARLKPADTAVIVGLGGVGMAALMTAVALERGPVIGVDLSPEKRKLAMGLGASDVFAPEDADASEVWGHSVIEAAGHPAAFETAVGLTADGGTTITVGLPHPDVRASISPLNLVTGARSITGSYLGSAVPQRDIPIFVDLWRSGRLPVEQLVDSYIGLEEINEGMDNLASGRVLRQMIRFADSDHGNGAGDEAVMRQVSL